MKNLKEGVYLRLSRQSNHRIYGLVTEEFRHIVKKQDGDQVFLKGHRSPFTIEGNYLKRGKDLWFIRGQK